MPLPIPKDPGLRQYRAAPFSTSLSTGNAQFDMLMSALLSTAGLAPAPRGNQGVYDAYLERERSLQFIKQMQTGVGSSLMFSRMGGMNTTSGLGGIASMMLGQPDGIMDSKMMRAINGGNPVRALMGLQAGMTGLTQGLAFGHTGNASPAQVQKFYQGITDQFYTHKIISQDDVDRVRQAQTDKVLKNKSFRSIFEDAISKDADGKNTVDFDKIKAQKKEYLKKVQEKGDAKLIEAYEEAIESADRMINTRASLGQKRAIRTNLEVTRGYELDDFTRTATGMMDAGLLFSKKRHPGPISGSEIQKLASSYSLNAGGSMRAVSQITGAKTMGEAGEDLSALLGGSTINFADVDQSKKMEELLRRFKGAARSAGVSIDAVMGILASSRALASTYSSLQYTGGLSAMDTTIKALHASTAMSATMGPEWVRKQGGSQAVANQVAETMTSNRDEPIVKQVAAWASSINEATNLTAEQKKAAIGKLSEFARSPGAMTPAGLSQMVNYVAGALNVTRAQALTIGSNETAQQAGMAFLEEERAKGNDLGIEEAAVNATGTSFMQAAYMSILGDQVDVRDADGNKLDENGRIQGFLDELGKGGNRAKLAQKYGLNRSPVISKYLNDPHASTNLDMYAVRSNKDYQSALKQQELLTNSYAKQSAHFDKKYAAMSGSVMTELVQNFMDGSLGDGLNEMLKNIKAPEFEGYARNVADAAKTLSTDKTSAAFLENFYQTRGGAADASEETVRKNLKAMGYSDNEIEQKLRERSDMSSEGLEDTLKMSQDLTISQILGASSEGGWENSKAKEKGYSQEQVKAAAKVLRASGINSTDRIKKYGSEKFNSDIYTKLGGIDAISATISIQAEEQKREIASAADKDIEEDLSKAAGSSDPKQQQRYKSLTNALKLLGTASFDDQGNLKDVDTAKTLDIMTSGSVLTDFGMSPEEIKKAVTSSTASSSLLDALEAGGYGSFDKEGGFQLDSKKLEAQSAKDEAVKVLRTKSAGLAQSSMDYAEQTKKEKEAIKGPEGLVEKAFSDLSNNLGSASKDIVKALQDLINILTTFNGAG